MEAAREYTCAMPRRLFAIVAAFGLFASLEAIELESLTIRDSVTYVNDASGLVGGAPMIVNAIGLSADLRLGGPFLVRPSLDFYSYIYDWPAGFSRPVPDESENELANLQSFFLDIPFFLRLDFAERFDFSFGLGLGFHLPFALRALDVPEAEQPMVQALGEWFYAEGRFFRPSIAMQFGYELNELFRANFWARLALPMYHLWDSGPDAESPFEDNLVLNVGFSVTVLLAPPPLQGRESEGKEAESSP